MFLAVGLIWSFSCFPFLFSWCSRAWFLTCLESGTWSGRFTGFGPGLAPSIPYPRSRLRLLGPLPRFLIRRFCLALPRRRWLGRLELLPWSGSVPVRPLRAFAFTSRIAVIGGTSGARLTRMLSRPTLSAFVAIPNDWGGAGWPSLAWPAIRPIPCPACPARSGSAVSSGAMPPAIRSARRGRAACRAGRS